MRRSRDDDVEQVLGRGNVVLPALVLYFVQLALLYSSVLIHRRRHVVRANTVRQLTVDTPDLRLVVCLANTRQQACAEPRTSALNMTPPAAAARAPAVIGRYLLLVPKLRQAADVDRLDRQTDGRTDIRPLHRPCTAYCANNVNKLLQY